MMDDLDFVVIHDYTLEQAVDDGMLVRIFENRWPELSGGRPIIATHSVFTDFSTAALVEIWNEYVHWRKNVMPSLPSEEQMFTTTMNSETLWLIDDGYALTILRPDEY